MLNQNEKGNVSSPEIKVNNSSFNSNIETIKTRNGEIIRYSMDPSKITKTIKLEDLTEKDLYEDRKDTNGVPILKRIERYPELPDDIFIPIDFIRADGNKVSDNILLNKKQELYYKDKNRIFRGCLTNKPSKLGYIIVGIEDKNIRVSRIMASTFLINPDPKVYEVVNHINHITTDNNLSNLNFVTKSENSNVKNGTSRGGGRKLTNSKLTQYIALDDSGNEVFRITKNEETNPNKYRLEGISESIKMNKKYRGYYWKSENRSREEFYKKINCTGNVKDYSWEPHSLYPNLYVCKEGFIKKDNKIIGSMDGLEGYVTVNLKNVETCRAHRIIMEHILKRKLKPDEIVDHINTIRTDNSFDNLRLTDWTGNANNPITKQKFKKKVLLVDLYGDFICYDERKELLKIMFPDNPEMWNNRNYICGSSGEHHKVTHRITNNNYLVITDLDTANQSILETIQEEIMYVFDREGNLIDALGTGNILKQLEEKYKITNSIAYGSIKYNRYTRKGLKFVKGGNIIEILKSLGHLTALNFKPEDTNKKDNN